MSLEHRVYGIPPRHKKRTLVAAFTPARWQWAMKLALQLELIGFRSVKLVTCEETEGQHGVDSSGKPQENS